MFKRIFVILFLFITMIFLVSSGNVLADANNVVDLDSSITLPRPKILPDSPLYVFKLAFEKLLDWFSFNKEKKAERYLQLAEERLAEAKILAQKGDVKYLSKTIERYKNRLRNAALFASKIKNDSDRMLNFFDKINSIVSKNEIYLQKIIKNVPDISKPALEKAVSYSQQITVNIISLKKQVLKTISENKEKVRKGIKKGLKRSADIAEEEIKKWGF